MIQIFAYKRTLFLYLIFISYSVNCMDVGCRQSGLLALCQQFPECIPCICLNTYAFCSTYANMAATCKTMNGMLIDRVVDETSAYANLMPYEKRVAIAILKCALENQCIFNNLSREQIERIKLEHIDQIKKLPNTISIPKYQSFDERERERFFIQHLLLLSPISENNVLYCLDYSEYDKRYEKPKNEEEKIVLFLKTYINVEHDDEHNRFLKKSLEDGHENLTHLLIERGCKINDYCSGKKSKRILMDHMRSNNVNKVSFLLKQGFNIDERNEYGSTYLMLAIHHQCDIEMIKLFIDSSIDINATNNLGGTALMYAVRENNHAAVCSLLDSGADANLKDFKGLAAYDMSNGKESFFTILAQKTSFWNKYGKKIKITSAVVIASAVGAVCFSKFR